MEAKTVEEKTNTESVSERIRKTVQPYLANITIPEDGDYRRQVREWQVEEYLKIERNDPVEDFKKPLDNKQEE